VGPEYVFDAPAAAAAFDEAFRTAQARAATDDSPAGRLLRDATMALRLIPD